MSTAARVFRGHISPHKLAPIGADYMKRAEHGGHFPFEPSWHYGIECHEYSMGPTPSLVIVAICSAEDLPILLKMVALRLIASGQLNNANDLVVRALHRWYATASWEM